MAGKKLDEVFPKSVWQDSDRTLWSAEIYPACDTIETAVKLYHSIMQANPEEVLFHENVI